MLALQKKANLVLSTAQNDLMIIPSISLALIMLIEICLPKVWLLSKTSPRSFFSSETNNWCTTCVRT